MSLPVTVPILSLEITKTILSDAEPTPQPDYEVTMVKDLGYTKLWIEFRVVES